jgi:hypothetical protein
MTTDNIKLAVECGAIDGMQYIPWMIEGDALIFDCLQLDNLISRVRSEDQAKIAKLEQELCDMTFAYNACSYLLDKMNK